MSDIIFNDFKKNIMNGTIDLDTDDIRLALVTSAYTADQDDHEFFYSITGEVTDTGLPCFPLKPSPGSSEAAEITGLNK